MENLNHPFVWGLALGLFFCACVLYVGASRYFQLRSQMKARQQELDSLKEHLNTQMSITAKGNEGMQQELEKIRTRNENLRVNLEALKRKPGREETRNLHLYDIALRRMHEQAPGFASAWEKALQQAEAELQEAEGGFKKLLSRVFRPSLKAPDSSRKALPQDSPDNDNNDSDKDPTFSTRHHST